ncbi:MAG TPA: hypothetical protein VMQ11_00590 [Alphaproteobacteria bacterium]|nr:hypothetical protein [Alphaproteobacteria bacterium]
MSLWKTEAELRAEKAKSAAAAAPAKLDSARKNELDGLLKRLAGIAAVFQMRADAVPVPAFRRIRELMDIYIAGGIRAISDGKDFLDHGVHLSDQEIADVHKLMRDIFHLDVAGTDAGKPPPK